MSNTKRLAVRKGVDNNNNTIINVTNPVNAQDAATKLYTDNLVAAETARAMAAESGVPTILTKTASYTLTAADNIILVNNTTTVTITLPTAAAAGAGRIYMIKRLSASGGSRLVTISAQASELIDGQNTALITAIYSSLTLVSNGSNWFII
jgi:hypothetical protein